ncbi:MAG: lysophospholipid acyltransferase family protein [Desulfobacterales bacterium]|nr:lysophospholipid acyltransferase family protein [Desulfobacterales bacterium]
MPETQTRGPRFFPDLVLYHIIYRFFFLIGLISPGLAARAANAAGRIWFVLDRRHREIAVENLTRAFGGQMSQAGIRSLARRAFCNLVRIIFEIGWSMHITDEDIRKYFRFRGMENLRAALHNKKGVLVFTAHIGNWELLPAAVGRIGYPISATYRPLDFKPLDMFFRELRSRDGAELLPKKRAMRKVLGSLKKNKLVGMMLDQNARVFDGVFTDFFGEPACTNKGLALLARETGTPVVPIFLVREQGYFQVECGRPLPRIKTGDKTKDIEALTRLYNKVIEDIIRRYPDQWFWVHKRWKTKPYKLWEPPVS